MRINDSVALFGSTASETFPERRDTPRAHYHLAYGAAEYCHHFIFAAVVKQSIAQSELHAYLKVRGAVVSSCAAVNFCICGQRFLERYRYLESTGCESRGTHEQWQFPAVGQMSERRCACRMGHTLSGLRYAAQWWKHGKQSKTPQLSLLQARSSAVWHMLGEPRTSHSVSRGFRYLQHCTRLLPNNRCYTLEVKVDAHMYYDTARVADTVNATNPVESVSTTRCT